MALIPLHPAAHPSRNTAPDGPASLVAGAGPSPKKERKILDTPNWGWRRLPSKKEFYNKTLSHDTRHGTGAHWH